MNGMSPKRSRTYVTMLRTEGLIGLCTILSCYKGYYDVPMTSISIQESLTRLSEKMFGMSPSWENYMNHVSIDEPNRNGLSSVYEDLQNDWVR